MDIVGRTRLTLTAPLVMAVPPSAVDAVLWVTRVDASSAALTIDWQGASEGHRAVVLDGSNDVFALPIHGINVVTFSADTYPVTFSWAITRPGGRLLGGRLAGSAGAPGGPVVSVQSPLVREYLSASATGAAAAISATLAAAAGKTTYLTSFVVTGGGATAASLVTVTVTGVIGGPLSFVMAIPAGATVGVTPLNVALPVPIAATAPNTAIVVNVPSFGVGNTSEAVVAVGYRE